MGLISLYGGGIGAFLDEITLAAYSSNLARRLGSSFCQGTSLSLRNRAITDSTLSLTS
jgi:hypothetical protein